MWTYNPSDTIAHARTQYFLRAGLSEEVYRKKFATYPILSGTIKLPTTGQIELHDIHHILTEYDTTWVGEFQLALWELGSGGSRKVAPWAFLLLSLVIGPLLAPAKSLFAFSRGLQSKNLLRNPENNYKKFDGYKVGELRQKLQIPPAENNFNIGGTLLFVFLFFIAIAAPVTMGIQGVLFLLSL